MSGSSSRGPPALDLLWAYQLKKEHAYLKNELDSVKDRSLKAERAAEAAYAASREVSELRRDLDDYMNDPQKIERSKIGADQLSEHAKQLAAINTRLNALVSVIRSAEDDLVRLDGKWNAHESKLNRFEDRMVRLEQFLTTSTDSNACEALSSRTRTLETQVNRLVEQFTHINDLHATVQSFQADYHAEIYQLKQALTEMRSNSQKEKGSKKARQKPSPLPVPVPQLVGPQSPNLLGSNLPDTFPNLTLSDPRKDLAAQEQPTQEAQIPPFPEPPVTETQATTQLDDSYNRSNIASEILQLPCVRPLLDEQVGPRKKQKVSQDTQGEQLRQMLRGDEFITNARPVDPCGDTRHTGGKQQGQAPSTSYEPTQRVEPPKPAAHSTVKKSKKPIARVSKKTSENAKPNVEGKDSVKPIATKQNQKKPLIDLTKPSQVASHGRSSRYRRGSTLQVLEHRGRGLKGCYARTQPKVEEPPGTTAVALTDNPPAVTAPTKKKRPVKTPRTALVKLSVPRKSLQALASKDNARNAS